MDLKRISEQIKNKLPLAPRHMNGKNRLNFYAFFICRQESLLAQYFSFDIMFWCWNMFWWNNIVGVLKAWCKTEWHQLIRKRGAGQFKLLNDGNMTMRPSQPNLISGKKILNYSHSLYCIVNKLCCASVPTTASVLYFVNCSFKLSHVSWLIFFHKEKLNNI